MKCSVKSLVWICFLLLQDCHQPQQDAQDSFVLPGNYTEQVIQHRREMDAYFRSAGSPLPDSSKAQFSGIRYFEIDTQFRVKATFQKVENGPVFKMQSTGSVADYYKTVGTLHFLLGGNTCVLEVYENQSLKAEGRTVNFIPFTDVTNGKSTYPGGRYLDVPGVLSENIILDFNYAYQPYCAYNHAYSCPLPPAANKLSVEVRAGERL